MPPILTLIALADPTRCRIIELLHGGPQPVHILAAEFSISRPAISRHLRVLKQAKLISEKKVGRENLYRVHAKRLEPVQSWLDDMLAKPKPETRASTKPSVRVPSQPVVAPMVKSRPVSQMGFDF